MCARDCILIESRAFLSILQHDLGRDRHGIGYLSALGTLILLLEIDMGRPKVLLGGYRLCWGQ